MRRTQRWWLLLVMLMTVFAPTPSAGADGDAGADGMPSPAVWPLRGPIMRGFDPPAQRWGSGHRGIDIAAPGGTPVRALAGGRVSFVGSIAGTPVVVVAHGAVRSTYQPVHASVRVSSRVSAGEVIGVLAGGGHCRAGCLHLGLKRGDVYLDPTLALNAVVPGVRLISASSYRATPAAAGGGGVAGFSGLSGTLARPADGPISSRFGPRFHPVLHVWKLHDGTDIAAPCGSPIRAALGGRVVSAAMTRGYGWRLVIDHGTRDGHHVLTSYNHAQGYSVRVGQTVRSGQQVGRVGSTGYSTGCHLHFSAWRDGRLIDPLNLR